MATSMHRASRLFAATPLLPLVLPGLIAIAGCSAAPAGGVRSSGSGLHPAAATTSAIATIAPELRDAAEALRQGASPSRYARGRVRADAAGRLQVYVHAALVTDALVQALQRAGLRQTSAVVTLGVVQGWVAPANLESLARVPGVSAVTPPTYAVTR